MNIQDAWVDDPLMRGERLVPRVCIQTDEYPDMTPNSLITEGTWSATKYGPFVEYFDVSGIPTDAGDFNIKFAGILAPVIDVSLFSDPSNPDSYTNRLALPVKRAIQLVRKRETGWRLLLNDTVAQNGGMLWTPVESRPQCKFFLQKKQEVCGNDYFKTVRSADFDIPYCLYHFREYQSRAAARRATASK